MKIAIIGCGNMGKAIAMRLSSMHEMLLYDHNTHKTKQLEKEGYGISCKDLQEVLQSAEMIMLAIKPQNLENSANSIACLLHEGQLLISLLTGTTLKLLKEHFPKATLIRMMPNLGLLCGEGVIGLCSDCDSFKDKEKTITQLFAPLGKTYWLPEDKINAITALGGSGPAFVFVFVEAMIDAGIAMGLPFKTSQEMVYQMLHGSITILKETQKSPEELKWQVASPEGTTIAGLRILESKAIRGGIMETFLAAYDRAKELS